MSVYLVIGDMQVTQATPRQPSGSWPTRARGSATKRRSFTCRAASRGLPSPTRAARARYTGPPPEQLRVMASTPREQARAPLDPDVLVRLRGAGAFPVELGLARGASPSTWDSSTASAPRSSWTRR